MKRRLGPAGGWVGDEVGERNGTTSTTVMAIHHHDLASVAEVASSAMPRRQRH